MYYVGTYSSAITVSKIRETTSSIPAVQKSQENSAGEFGKSSNTLFILNSLSQDVGN